MDLPADLVQQVFEQISLDLLDEGSDRAALVIFLDEAAPLATEGLKKHTLISMIDDRTAIPSITKLREQRELLAEEVVALSTLKPR